LTNWPIRSHSRSLRPFQGDRLVNQATLTPSAPMANRRPTAPGTTGNPLLASSLYMFPKTCLVTAILRYQCFNGFATYCPPIYGAFQYGTYTQFSIKGWPPQCGSQMQQWSWRYSKGRAIDNDAAIEIRRQIGKDCGSDKRRSGRKASSFAAATEAQRDAVAKFPPRTTQSAVWDAPHQLDPLEPCQTQRHIANSFRMEKSPILCRL
jgi:hypothetical protein